MIGSRPVFLHNPEDIEFFNDRAYHIVMKDIDFCKGEPVLPSPPYRGIEAHRLVPLLSQVECEASCLGEADCAHFVLNSTSLQLIPAYSSQSSNFPQTLAGVT
jgi:hypothetical protein